MKEKILITSALPYANGPLHFGHIAGAYLPGDCYARFMRLLGNDVLYVCGSDEYGVAITMSAEKAGKTPKEHIDFFHDLQKKMFQELNFSFDHFSRTTWEGHIPLVQKYFLDLLNNGYIEEKITDQLYSEEEDRFLADRYVEGTCPKCGFEKARGDECPKCGASYDAVELKNPVSKATGKPLRKKATKHWFLLLDKLRPQVLKWIQTKNWKPNVMNFIKGYIQDLHPRAITRDSKWGVPIPLEGTEGKVLYVWFDAPIGYLSATKEWSEKIGEKEKWKEYWCDPKTKLVQFIGKDNIPFHAVIFPAMTMGQNESYKMVDELPANEFFNLEGKKFNKSEGWYIDLEDFFSKYSSDQIRFCIAANAPETSDADFSFKDFQTRCNSELVGKFGNFIHRTLVFAKKNTQGKIPEIHHLEQIDLDFQEKIKFLIDETKNAYASFQLRKAAKLIMELAQEGNVYFDQKSPWKDAKNSETFSRMETTIALCLSCVKALSLIASPILPISTKKIQEMIGIQKEIQNKTWDEIKYFRLIPGNSLQDPVVLFAKIEDEEIQKEIEKLKKMSQKEQKSEEKPNAFITIDDFKKVELKVGKILRAETIVESKKLLYLEVDLGEEKRNIVSGIREKYLPEEIIGKHVVVISNLKPAKVMGRLSQGMLLAGGDGSNIEILEVDNLPPGTKIF